MYTFVKNVGSTSPHPWLRMIVFVLVNGMCCYGCWEQERIALLHLKASINHPYGNSLLSWVDDRYANCCQWKAIQCSNSSKRVIEISLAYTRDWRLSNYDWVFNASLFLPFEELKTLNLRGNRLAGWVHNEGFKKLSTLINLEVLDLSDTKFNNTILESIGEISSLKSLYLAFSNKGASIDLDSFKRLSMLINLEDLDLRSTQFNDTILEFVSEMSSLRFLYLADNNIGTSIDLNSFKKFSMLTNLEILDLNNNQLNDTILEFVGEISSLRSLYLENNNLRTSIDLSSFKRLSMLINLEILDLRGNQLNDTILEFVGEIPSLRSLFLSSNNMKASTNLNSFKRLLMLINLEVLELTNNQLNDTILEFVGEISSLRSLYLAFNNMGTSINLNNFRRLSRLRNLELLDLGHNYLNSSILTFIGGISSLKFLDLSNNYIGGPIDINSEGGFQSLKTLKLEYNDKNVTFSGRALESLSSLENLFLDQTIINNDFLSSIRVMTSLQVLSMQECGLIGSLPTEGLCELKTFQELNIRGNELRGTLPWCLANLTSLRLLDISFNYFNGNIAFSPLVNLTTLEYLALSNNQFEVPISFKSFLNHSKLKVLESLNNKLVVEGECHSSTPSFQLAVIRLSNLKSKNYVGFPHFLYHQNELQVIQLSQIDFNGKWPNWLLENNSRLATLLMRDNSLQGSILQLPLNPITGLLVLDISNNHIEGYIPYKLASIFPGLIYLNMSTNGFKGDIPSSLGDLTSLEFLDLSNNQLFGKIPAHLAMGCESLFWLSLSNNNLIGPILLPQTNSSIIEYLLLDNNQFTQIPKSLSINSLRLLNVGNNQLAGKIPRRIWNLLPTLWILSLSNNNFEGPIPIELCELQYLSELDLSNNYFTGIVPSCFSNLSWIEFVLLSNNRLSGPFPDGFRNSSKLTMLDLSNNCLSNDIPKWIGSLSQLQKLLLKNNNFEGNIPNEICHLSNLTVIDLSWNNFFGDIPHCLRITEVKTYYQGPFVHFTDPRFISSFVLKSDTETGHPDYIFKLENQMEFITKGISLSYKGVPLDLFSAIDLSNNKLTGCIPPGIGNLSRIKSLNLSHNTLIGPIPATFSNLENIESLDLSYNSLQGNIPYKLTGLHYLAKFNVSYNNLSGMIPEGLNQFQTFDGSSYIGNPLLCGEKVPNSCNSLRPTPSPNNGSEVEFGFIDMGIFYMSFAGSYLTALLAIAGILYINPHWRQGWIHFVEVFITSCCYFVMDNLWKIKARFLHKQSPI